MDELSWYKEQYLAWKETAMSQSETIKMQNAKIASLTREIELLQKEYENKISKFELSSNRLNLEEEKLNLRKVRECRAQINSYLEIVKELRRGSINKDQAIALGLPERFFEIAEQAYDKNINEHEAYTLLRDETLIEMQNSKERTVEEV